MICSYCNKREAIVHYTEMVNGEIKNYSMCEICAKDLGLADKLPLSVQNLMSQILGEKEDVNILEDADFAGLECPKCGMLYADILANDLKVGCAECYNVFEKYITKILYQKKENKNYCGKIPLNFDETIDLQAEILKKEKELETAIAEERYEDCSALRDEILAFEKKRQCLKN